VGGGALVALALLTALLLFLRSLPPPEPPALSLILSFFAETTALSAEQYKARRITFVKENMVL
jgi:hypothetical protein